MGVNNTNGYYRHYLVIPTGPVKFLVTSSNSSKLLYSSNGIDWTEGSVNTTDKYSIVQNTSDYNELVCVGGGADYSNNGLDWSNATSTSPSAGVWWDVVYAKEIGLYVACGGYTSGGRNGIMTSPDGLTWTTRSLPGSDTGTLQGIAWSGSVFAVVGENNKAFSSTDGINWTARTIPGPAKWKRVTYSPDLGLFVAVNEDTSTSRVDKIATSTDAITWTLRTSPKPAGGSSPSWRDVAWSPELGLFVAVADQNTNYFGTYYPVGTSPDGITWTIRSTGSDPAIAYFRSVAWSSELSLFCATGIDSVSSKFMTSPDGITWTKRDQSNQSSWSKIIFAK